MLSLQSSRIDSTLSKPDFTDSFPYHGVYWDKARINIDLFISSFKNSKLLPSVRVLKKELEKPVIEKSETSGNPEVEEKRQSSSLLCSELESPPQIRGGLDVFLENVGTYNSDTKEIEYSLSINQRGIVEEFEMVSQVEIERDIREDYDNAIESELIFDPVLVEGEAVRIQCTFKFPVR